MCTTHPPHFFHLEGSVCASDSAVVVAVATLEYLLTPLVGGLTTMVSNHLGPSNPSLMEMAYLVPPQEPAPNSVLLGTLLF